MEPKEHVPGADVSNQAGSNELSRLMHELEESRAREQAGREREARLRDQIAAGIAREEAAGEKDAKNLRAEQARTSRGMDFRDRVVAILGHDLRNPLSAITVATNYLLRASDIPSRHARTLGRIAHSADRMTRMINDLLDFARGQFGERMPLFCKPSDMEELCRSVIAEAELAHDHRSVLFERHGDANGVWDPDRVMQTLSNLISNAMAHGKDPIRVILRGEGGDVTLEVSNHGVIPADALPGIFEPFLKASHADLPTRSGLGLGLFIVREIVVAHGGTINVTSTENEGTIFRVKWPRTTPAPSKS